MTLCISAHEDNKTDIRLHPPKPETPSTKVGRGIARRSLANGGATTKTYRLVAETVQLAKPSPNELRVQGSQRNIRTSTSTLPEEPP